MTPPTTLPKLFRTLPVELPATREASDEAAPPSFRIPVAISSEYEVQRWFGGEILDHAPEAIDRTYLDRGMAVLVDHDTGRHIGRVENATIGADRVLRGEAVFDEQDPEAVRIHGKVARGFMPYTSVGYRLNELKLERADKKTGAETYRATRWTPYEVSFVAVPADPTVGAGRNTGEAVFPVAVRVLDSTTAPQGQENTVSEQNTAAPSGAAPEVRVTRSAENGEAVREIAALANQHAMSDKLSAWITEGRSVDEVRGEIIAELRSRLERGPVVKPRVELTEREEKQYSFARAILAQEDGEKCFEREVHEDIARNLPQGYKPQGGFFIPTNVRFHGKRAGLDSATATAGAEVKFVQNGPFIEQLRNSARVMQAGATMLSGLDGPVTMPKQNGAGTASWVGENPGVDVAESNLLFTTVSLAAKTLQSTTSFSRQLLRQAVVDVEALVRADIAAVHGLAIDAAALYGTGASNQPQGIYTATGVNVVALGTNGAAPSYANMVNLGVVVEEANAADLGAAALITTPGIKGTLKLTQKFSGTDGAAVWGDDNVVAGMRGYSTNQVQSNLTKGTGTDLHAIYAGVWSQLILGEFGAMEILTDPYRLKKQGMIEVTSFQMIDIAVRHGAAFAVIKDAISQF